MGSTVTAGTETTGRARALTESAPWPPQQQRLYFAALPAAAGLVAHDLDSGLTPVGGHEGYLAQPAPELDRLGLLVAEAGDLGEDEPEHPAGSE